MLSGHPVFPGPKYFLCVLITKMLYEAYFIYTLHVYISHYLFSQIVRSLKGTSFFVRPRPTLLILPQVSVLFVCGGGGGGGGVALSRNPQNIC